MPGRSEDKLFWCIVLSIVLMFIKDGFIIIAIIWGVFFVVVLPIEAKSQKRTEEYMKLEKYPDKYKKAMLRVRDICSGNIMYVDSVENYLKWWYKELDAETREYIRKTDYYDSHFFRVIKNHDTGEKTDKEYINICNTIGKENMEAVECAIKISNGKSGLSPKMEIHWWEEISPKAREIIRKTKYYNSDNFCVIRSNDEKMERIKFYPEFKEKQ